MMNTLTWWSHTTVTETVSFSWNYLRPHHLWRHPHTFPPLAPNTLSGLPPTLSPFPRDPPLCPVTSCPCSATALTVLHCDCLSIVYSSLLDSKFLDGKDCVLYKLLYPQPQSSVAFRSTQMFVKLINELMNISILYYITKSLVIPENALNNEKSKRTDTHEYFTGGYCSKCFYILSYLILTTLWCVYVHTYTYPFF